MSIFGIGADIVSVARIDAALARFGARFAERILDDTELAEFGGRNDPARFLAKRFAAKEAFAKALGLGIRRPLALRRARIAHDALGKPTMVCHAEVTAYMARVGAGEVHLSISDEREHALAFVVLEKATRQS